MEHIVKVSNMVMATAVWLLSPDDTQAIDLPHAFFSSERSLVTI
jgi:hypothetical protein